MDETGRKIILNIFNKGDYFGEMSFIDGAPRCAAVETIHKCRLLILPGEKFNTAILTHPTLCFNLMKELLQKLRNATNQIESLVFQDVYQRMARFLTDNSHEQGKDRVVEGHYTQQRLADLLGASREMIGRVYNELKNGNYIAVKKRQIIIKKELPYLW
jgi:CRP/FNR family cyclic AMP-dependent transcriptional regulator